MDKLKDLIFFKNDKKLKGDIYTINIHTYKDHLILSFIPNPENKILDTIHKSVINSIVKTLFEGSKKSFLDFSDKDFQDRYKMELLLNKVEYNNLILSPNLYTKVASLPNFKLLPIKDINNNYTSLVYMGKLNNINIIVNEDSKWNSNHVINFDCIKYDIIFDKIDNEKSIEVKCDYKFEVDNLETIFLFESKEDNFYYLKTEFDRSIKIKDILK
jgi:hypothetical protein